MSQPTPSFYQSVVREKAVRVTAPDGSQVDILAAARGGSMACFSLRPGLVSKPVRHKTVEELWFITSGHGEMWLREGEKEAIITLHAGVSLSIPQGVAFQFRSFGPQVLEAVGVTMPPWPGMDEAEFVDGKW